MFIFADSAVRFIGLLVVSRVGGAEEKKLGVMQRFGLWWGKLSTIGEELGR